MVIPIIHSKNNLRGKIIAFTIFTSVILILLILLSSNILATLDYKILELIVILILISQISFTLYIYLSKKYNVVGDIFFNENDLIIKKGKNKVVYNIEKIIEPKILLSNYELTEDPDSLKNNSDAGDYIIFQYNDKTLVYELLFKNKKSTDNFLDYLKNKFPKNKLEILYN